MSCNAVRLTGGSPKPMNNLYISNAYGKTRPDRPAALIRVRAAAGNRRRGWLMAGQLVIPVPLGRGGILANKREGDGATPKGTYRLRRLWWRADHHPRPKTFLPIRAIKRDDAWCEDPASRHYNQPIKLGGDAGGDRLMRDDQLYDFIIEIDHNTSPRVAGRGSAVFLHLARPDFSPTAGCVSMKQSDMLQLLRRIGPETKIVIE